MTYALWQNLICIIIECYRYWLHMFTFLPASMRTCFIFSSSAMINGLFSLMTLMTMTLTSPTSFLAASFTLFQTEVIWKLPVKFDWKIIIWGKILNFSDCKPFWLINYDFSLSSMVFIETYHPWFHKHWQDQSQQLQLQ